MASGFLLPNVLLTNDDGIDAPGLKVLAEVAGEIARDVWIVAPEHEHSGASQSLSLCRPIRCTAMGEKRIAVDGSPGDCIALALSHFMAKARPSLILSGVNAGSNIGEEVNMSGTIGAALIALMLDVPAIAISQACKDRLQAPWETTRVILPKVLRHLLTQGWRKETCLSVNIPDVPPGKITGFSWARQSQKNVAAIKAEKRISPRHEDYFWLTLTLKTPSGAANSEGAIMRRNEVAVTALSLDRSVEIAKPSVAFGDTETMADDDDE